jgi:hypothetical protein
MRRKFLCGLAASLGAASLEAQTVPARDLWEFPLGAILQPAALSADPAGGLWNPAAHGIKQGERIRLGATSLSAASDQGVGGQMLGINVRRDDGRTFGLSVARSAIEGVVRTDFDPQATGEVPYSSLIVSATATRVVLPHVELGLALRWREGRVDEEVRHALAADLGVIATNLPFRDARIGISSFLWRPGREIEDRPSVVAAADVSIYTRGTNAFRLGYSYNAVNRGSREYGPYVLSQLERLEANIGVLATSVSGRRVSRIRSGLALRYASYLVGVGREEGVSGLGPLYQFTLSSTIR